MSIQKVSIALAAVAAVLVLLVVGQSGDRDGFSVGTSYTGQTVFVPENTSDYPAARQTVQSAPVAPVRDEVEIHRSQLGR